MWLLMACVDAGIEECDVIVRTRSAESREVLHKDNRRPMDTAAPLKRAYRVRVTALVCRSSQMKNRMKCDYMYSEISKFFPLIPW